MRVGILGNPSSGRNRGGEWQRISGVVEDHPGAQLRAATDPNEMREALAAFARDRIELLVISGGDGTVQGTLTLLQRERPFERRPLLTVLPTGTTNMTAGDLGQTGRPHRSLRRLLEWAAGRVAAKPTPVERPLLEVFPGAGRPPEYGLFLGAAAVLQGMRYYRHHIHTKGIRGELGPALTLIRLLPDLFTGSQRHIHAEQISIAVDTYPWQQLDCLLLLLTTLERFFFGLHPFWGKHTGPIHRTLVLRRPRHLLRVLPALLRGRGHPALTPENGFLGGSVAVVALRLESGFSLDGELFDTAGQDEPVRVGSTTPVTFHRL